MAILFGFGFWFGDRFGANCRLLTGYRSLRIDQFAPGYAGRSFRTLRAVIGTTACLRCVELISGQCMNVSQAVQLTVQS
ncbi:MAG: hypothetical protein ACI85K_001855 [Hyphomicrobiaceae bacterium]|jgi:hypothetical protein